MSKHFIQAAIDTGQYFITATSMRNISIEVADVRGQFTAIAIYAAAWSPTVRVGWGSKRLVILKTCCAFYFLGTLLQPPCPFRTTRSYDHKLRLTLGPERLKPALLILLITFTLNACIGYPGIFPSHICWTQI